MNYTTFRLQSSEITLSSLMEGLAQFGFRSGRRPKEPKVNPKSLAKVAELVALLPVKLTLLSSGGILCNEYWLT